MRYFSPRAPQYQSGFVPEPLDFLQGQLNQKQAAYNKGDLASHAILDATGVQARKEDQQAANEIAKSYQERIDKLGEEMQGDKSSTKYLEGIKQIGRDLNKDLTNGDLAIIKNNKEVYDKYNEQVSKFKDDQSYHEYLDSQYGNIVEGRYKGYKGDNGYNISKVGNIDKQLDRTKKADELIQGIGSEANSGVKFVTDANGNKYIQDVNGSRVTDQKILNAFVPAFKNTEEYNQIVKEAKFLEQEGKIDNAQDYVNSQVNDLAKFVTNKYRKSDTNIHLSADAFDLQNKKHELDNPIINIGMPVTNNQWINAFGTSEAVSKQKIETKQGVKDSWKQMMLDSPELWSQYGIKSAKDIDTMAGVIEAGAGGGFDSWMKSNGNNFGNKANTVNSSLVENRMVSQLDKEADDYASKFVDNKEFEDKAKTIGYTSSELNSIITNGNTVIPIGGVLMYNGHALGNSPEDQKIASDYYTYQDIKEKHPNIVDAYSKKVSLYESKRDEYLADRAKTVETSQTGWSTIDVIDPNTHQVDKKSSDNLNRQLQGYFSKPQNLTSVNTTMLDKNGLPMTVQQVIDQEAEKQGVKADKIKIGTTPLYGTGYDKKTGQVQRNMYLTVGGEQIPIDMSSVNVAINGQVQPLSNIDNNPVQQTNLWITNTFGHGIQSYTPDNTIPKEVVGAADDYGNIIVPSNSATFKVSRPATGKQTSFSDNSTTKVEILNTNGQVVSTLVGAPAFQFLQSVQATQGLK